MQVNLHFALGGYDSRLRVVVEIRTIDLIEAARVAAVNGDAYVVELSVAAFLILDGVPRADRKDGAPFLGLRDRESFRRLLDLDI